MPILTGTRPLHHDQGGQLPASVLHQRAPYNPYYLDHLGTSTCSSHARRCSPGMYLSQCQHQISSYSQPFNLNWKSLLLSAQTRCTHTELTDRPAINGPKLQRHTLQISLDGRTPTRTGSVSPAQTPRQCVSVPRHLAAAAASSVEDLFYGERLTKSSSPTSFCHRLD